jgi:methyltransferase family protein
MSDYEKTLEIIFGRWKSQILYAGVKLGVFDCLTSEPRDTVRDIAEGPKYLVSVYKLDLQMTGNYHDL